MKSSTTYFTDQLARGSSYTIDSNTERRHSLYQSEEGASLNYLDKSQSPQREIDAAINQLNPLMKESVASYVRGKLDDLKSRPYMFPIKSSELKDERACEKIKLYGTVDGYEDYIVYK